MRQEYDSSHIWKHLTKRQKRHLDLSSQLLQYSQSYFVAKLDVCFTEYPAQMLPEKNMKRRYGVTICMGESEDQGLGRWKVKSNRGASLTKKGLVGAINQGASWKVEDQRPGGWEQAINWGE